MRQAAILLLLLLAAGCGAATSNDCSDADVRAFLQSTDAAMAAFGDQTERARSTGRINMPPIVGEMQKIRRDLAAAKRPACADEAALALVSGMDQAIAAQLAFMRSENRESIDAQADAATEQFGKARELMADLRVRAA